MAEAKIPENEEDRLRALYAYDLLDRDLDVVFDTIIRIAADTCDTDVSVIALIDRDRQYFLARNGMKPRQTPRAIAFCAHAILKPDTIFEISDATIDPRFLDNPLVTGEIGVRFYAAQPLVTAEGLAIGGLCLIGKKPKSLNDLQRDTLRNLGNIIMTLFEARKTTLVAADQLMKAHDELEARVEERTRELKDEMAEREALEEQFRQAQKMEAIGQLTGGVAHDFNNLLGIIMGNAELLLVKVGESDPKIQAVIRAAARGAELTRRLLAFSRKQTLQPQAVEVTALVRGMKDLLDRTLGETIEITASATPGLWPAKVDPGQLENALLNLAVNARDAMPQGGALVIEASNASVDEAYARGRADVAPGDYVVLAMSDSGSGMSLEVQEHALEPFFTTKDVGEGSGLGLAMIYGFVKQSGGHVAIYSEEGQGTTIKLYLPRAAEEAARVSEETAAEAPRARGETLLVVEDDADLRQLAVTTLEDLGYRILQAPDGWAALSVLAGTAPPDLLLTDVVLPRGLSGPDLVEKVKRELPAIKVLFMSGDAESAARHNHNGLAGNGAELLNKPFRRRELALKVRGALDR